MIKRISEQALRRLARGFPVVAITAPRQSGKTTLARAPFPDKPYLSLEDPDTRTMAEADPRRLLSAYPDDAILDEVQRTPQLFSHLQSHVDANLCPGTFILTGSQQFGLISGGDRRFAAGTTEIVPWGQTGQIFL